MLDRAAGALRRVMLRTARSPLAPLWGALHSGVARALATLLAPWGSDATVYLTGSFASGEPVYGLSDIDLLVVAGDQTGRRRAERRLDRMMLALPPLRRLLPHVWCYDDAELRAAASAPYPTYDLDRGGASFMGRAPLRDPMGLQERPGLHGPATEWRRLRGRGAPPARLRDRQGERLVAWLELQYRWRYAVLACAGRGAFHAANCSAGLVAEAARTWLWLAHGERADGRRAPLQRASHLLEEEREPLRLALRLHERVHRSPPAPLAELVPCFARLSRRIAELIEHELAVGSATAVALDGAVDPAGGLPLLDWRALALPPLDWSQPDLPFLREERFSVVPGNPGDPLRLAEAAACGRRHRWTVLRSGVLLVQASIDVWGIGQLRGPQLPASDPVSFALADGRPSAAFPDARGWSARDRARRAVAEHAAWLGSGREDPSARPAWVGVRPAPIYSTPATIGLLLSAARAALFLESVEAGAPRLALTHEAAVRDLANRDFVAGEAAREALEALRTCMRESRPPSHRAVGWLREVVGDLPAYSENEAVALRSAGLSITARQASTVW
jgi:hypothetical protein